MLEEVKIEGGVFSSYLEIRTGKKNYILYLYNKIKMYCGQQVCLNQHVFFTLSQTVWFSVSGCNSAPASSLKLTATSHCIRFDITAHSCLKDRTSDPPLTHRTPGCLSAEHKGLGGYFEALKGTAAPSYYYCGGLKVERHRQRVVSFLSSELLDVTRPDDVEILSCCCPCPRGPAADICLPNRQHLTPWLFEENVQGRK